MLSQWRAYGNDGKGVAIGFNAELFNEFAQGSYYLTKVIYDQVRLWIFCTLLLKGLLAMQLKVV